MITLTVKYQCHPGKSAAVLDALRRMSVLVKEHEPGCRAYQISQSNEDSDALFLYEVYDDQAALDFHAQTPHFKEIVQGEAIPLLLARERALYSLVIE